MNMNYVKSIALICALLTLGNANAADVLADRCVGEFTKTMSDGASVTFWGYGAGTGMGGCSSATVPAEPVSVGVGDTLKMTLQATGMMPHEAAPYAGHTIHLHGADVDTVNDGVPDTSQAITMGPYTYNFTPSNIMYGSYPYHCHVHTVKHLEMGMYGAMIVRPKAPAGYANSIVPGYMNQINDSSTTAYDFEQIYLFSTVDPAYHIAIQDDPVFADYNPSYFLINGNESAALKPAQPASTLTAARGKKVALRLIGMHSVNGTFEIRDTPDTTGTAQAFTVYAEDGRSYTTPETVKSLDIAPGQRFDIIFTTPTSPGALYPQITYKKLRVDPKTSSSAIYATAYGKVTF